MENLVAEQGCFAATKRVWCPKYRLYGPEIALCAFHAISRIGFLWPNQRLSVSDCVLILVEEMKDQSGRARYVVRTTRPSRYSTSNHRAWYGEVASNMDQDISLSLSRYR